MPLDEFRMTVFPEHAQRQSDAIIPEALQLIAGYGQVIQMPKGAAWRPPGYCGAAAERGDAPD
jgi:hypothetical protein